MAVRSGFPAVEHVDSNVGDFVADDLAKQIGVLRIKESWVDANIAGLRPTTAERSAETPASFDLNLLNQVVDAPKRRPLVKPSKDLRRIHNPLPIRGTNRFYDYLSGWYTPLYDTGRAGRRERGVHRGVSGSLGPVHQLGVRSPIATFLTVAFEGVLVSQPTPGLSV